MCTCVKCGEHKQHKGHGMCRSCYNTWWHDNNPGYTTEWFHQTGKCNPLNENRLCSQYLGIFVAEKVLAKVFKNVERMSINHSGYDFICNNGYKIDVKASCRRVHKSKSDNWIFKNRQNKVTDYFLCIAFNNRDDLDPEHLWLIPNINIDNQTAISISESTLFKWDAYKLDINKVVKCCNTIKQDHINHNTRGDHYE